MTVLDIQTLQINLDLTRGSTPIVRGVSLSLKAGEKRGLVGESRAGKTIELDITNETAVNHTATTDKDVLLLISIADVNHMSAFDAEDSVDAAR